MAILPLQTARVSNLLRTNLAQSQISRTQSELLKTQNELSTGKRINVASDDPGDAAVVQQLQKTLEQRNRLLRDIRDSRASFSAFDVIPAWNQQLALHGARLVERRRQFLGRLRELAADIHQTLSDDRDVLDINYVPSFNIDGAVDEAAVEARFIEALDNVMEEELARGTTARGPQRDDVVFTVNGQDCRLFGSQGQQRTVALSLKLAERQLIEELVGEPPILLLDDVLSDLDDVRRHHLFDLTAQCGSQTFLSCTNLRAFSKEVLGRSVVYTVTSGEVTRE